VDKGMEIKEIVRQIKMREGQIQEVSEFYLQFVDETKREIKELKEQLQHLLLGEE
jgi:hypothetical protein